MSIDNHQKIIQHHIDMFKLSPNFTVSELKKAFFEYCQYYNHHTQNDKKSESDHKKVIDGINAFQELKLLASIDGIIEYNILKTTDGSLLTDLGKGLINKNGKECIKCKGKGYKEYENGPFEYIDCDICFGYGGWLEVKCKFCNNGYFEQTNKKPTICKRCKGTSIVHIKYFANRYNCPSNYKFCSSCVGGVKAIPVNHKTYYEKCYHCKGTGEIECFNPVLMKLALFNKGVNK
jgi:hypothetical protein